MKYQITDAYLDSIPATSGGLKVKRSEYASLNTEKARIDYLNWNDSLMSRYIVSVGSVIPEGNGQEDTLRLCGCCGRVFQISNYKTNCRKYPRKDELDYYEGISKFGKEESVCPECDGTISEYKVMTDELYALTEVEPGMRRCNKCKKIKPIEAYYKEARTKDGYKTICKSCIRENLNKRYSRGIK